MDAGTLQPLQELDATAMLVRNSYGNRGNWLFSFRMGMQGHSNRLLSLDEHQRLVFEWHADANMVLHDRNTSIMLFCMDSACECLVFALNALGQAVSVGDFRDVTNEAALRSIAPRDVYVSPLPGWQKVFPSFQRHFQSHAELLRIIMDNHAVTKHRQQGFMGGTMRDDPPPGFYEHLGFGDNDLRRHIIQPMKSAPIPKRPKLPMEERSKDPADWIGLEVVAAEFRAFIYVAAELAASDARANIKLPS